MSALGDLLSGAGEEGKTLFLWGLLVGLVDAATKPWQRDLEFAVNDFDPNIPLSPADYATAVNRSFIDKADAAANVKKQGINNDLFDILIDLAGNAPAPGDLAVMLRRGLIQEKGTGPNAVTFEQGIHEGNLRNKWTDLMKDLAVEWPTPADAIDALVKGQVDETTGKDLYRRFGGDPQFFDLLVHTVGNPPGPDAAGTAANRGIIPWSGRGPDVLSFEQAVLEGRTKDKWLPVLQKLQEYLPPPRTITALERAGSITQDEALRLYEQHGLSPDLAAAYVRDASNQKVAGDKQIAKADVQALYKDHLISRSDAQSMLESLGYSTGEADFLLSITDLELSQAQINNAITKIRTLFVGHKISSTDTVNALNTLGVPPDQVGNLISTWQLEATANVKLLTEAQIVDAWAEGFITQDEAMGKLENLGYSPEDAWILLSIKNKGPLPNRPPPGPAPGSLIPPPPAGG